MKYKATVGTATSLLACAMAVGRTRERLKPQRYYMVSQWEFEIYKLNSTSYKVLPYSELSLSRCMPTYNIQVFLHGLPSGHEPNMTFAPPSPQLPLCCPAQPSHHPATKSSVRAGRALACSYPASCYVVRSLTALIWESENKAWESHFPKGQVASHLLQSSEGCLGGPSHSSTPSPGRQLSSRLSATVQNKSPCLTGK